VYAGTCRRSESSLTSAVRASQEKRTKFTVITSDGTKTKIDRKNAGDNGYELVSIGKSNVVSLVVTFYGSAAITEINYAPVPPKCRTIDFEGFKAGDVVSDLGYGASVLAVKRNKKKGPLAWGEAMIFDSSNPTGDVRMIDAFLRMLHAAFSASTSNTTLPLPISDLFDI
jgi:hypothetical protein